MVWRGFLGMWSSRTGQNVRECGRKGCRKPDPTSPAWSKAECQQHHIQIVFDLGKAGFSDLAFYQMTHCLQSQNYKKGKKLLRMEGRALKSGTRCDDVTAAMSGSSYIILILMQNSTWILVCPVRFGICLFLDALEETRCCRKSPLQYSGLAVTTGSNT